MASLMKICSISRPAYRITNQLLAQGTVVVGVNSLSSKFHLLSPRQAVTAPAAAKSVSENREVWSTKERGNRFENRNVTLQTRERRGQSAIDQHFGELEAQVRTWNHVSEKHIEDLLTVLQTRGSVSSQQSLMILRCVGSLMLHKSPKDRAIYAAQVWERLSKLGAVFDVTHYNARLRTQLENKDMFSTVSVLEEMEKNSINPNRVTYLLLVARHCEEGDIEGASKIIDFMKSQDMSVNEFVFNALIKGYLRKGDNANAQEVIKTMKNMGLEPSHETYRVMAEVQAAAGNLSAIRETFEKAKAENIEMKAKHVYSAIVELVLNGHGAKLPEMLELLQDKRLYLNDVRTTVAELLVHGHDDFAYTVYTNFTAHSGTSGGQGRILLRTLIQLGRPFEKVIEFQNKLAEAGHRVDDVSSLLFFSLGLPKPEYNLNALTVVRSAGEDLRPHYYVPIFQNFEESKNKEGIYKTAKHLRSNCKTQEALIRIFTNCVQPLLRLGDSFDAVQQRLKDDAGYSSEEMQSVEAAFLVSEGRFKDAQKIVELLKGPVIVRSSFVHGIAKNSNFNEVAELLNSYQHTGKIRDVLSSSILYIINESSLTAEQLGKFITSLIDKKVKIYSDLYNPIVEALQKRGVPAKVMENFDDLVTKGNTNLASTLSEDYRRKSIAELEELREDRISDGAQSTTTIDIELLRKYCFSGNIAKADEMKAFLDSRGFIYKPDLLIVLASLALVHKKNAAEFQNYKEQLESLYPDSKYKIPIFLFEIGHKINDGASVTDVFEALTKFSEQEKLGRAESREHTGAVNFIVNHAQQKWKSADIEQLVDKLVSLNYVTEDTSQPVNFVVTSYLKANDIDNAVRVWEKNISPDKRPTMFSAILEKIIQAEDPVRLQKVVDVLTSVLGEMVALHHLAKSFVVCGKVKQAQKVFETPGLRAQNLIMKNDANRMARLGQVKELEAYFSVAKDVFLVDKEELLFHLLRAHCVNKNYAKAQETLTVFEEHNIQPRGRTLRYLANVLQGAGLPVTFSVPEATEGKDDGSQGFVVQKRTSKSTAEKRENEPRAVKSHKSPRADKPKEAADKPKEATDKLKEAADKPKEAADKPRKAADKPRKTADKRPEMQKDMLEQQVAQWGKEGNVQDIEKMIDNNAIPTSVRHHARKCLLSAYLNSGREQELEKMLRETDDDNLSQLVTSVNLVQLSKKNEALFDEVCSRIVNKQPLNLPALDNVVRTYFLTNRFKEARNVFSKIPEVRKVIRLKSLCKAAYSIPETEAVYNELLDLFKDSPRSREPLNQAIILQCEKGDAKKALNYIENAEKSGIVLSEALWGFTVQNTEKLLGASGLPLPWPANMVDQCKEHEVYRKEQQIAARQASKSSSSA